MIGQVAVASMSVVAGYAVAGLVARGVLAGARWLARKTKTRKDDDVVEGVTRFLDRHPEALPTILQAIDDYRRLNH